MNPLKYALLCLAVSCFLAIGVKSDAQLRQNVTEEMQLITKSLEDLLGELNVIKREANGRLTSVKNRASGPSGDQSERIRQTKVSKFVLKRVAELELESLGMREDLEKLFKQQKTSAKLEARQEDHDFDEGSPAPAAASSSSAAPAPTSSEGMPSETTTLKPEEEAAKIGFDLEALKKLGEEIGKRVDQFGKEAAKNLGDLLQGVKLVFREPNSTAKASTPRPATTNRLADVHLWVQ